MVEQVQKVQENEITGYLNNMQDNFYALGNVHIDSNLNIKVGNYQLPAMQTDKGIINNKFDFVDNTSKLTGTNATVFEFYNNEFIRIATNVKDQDGQRAVGTAIKSDSDVFKALIQGGKYIGRANVVGQMYITGYAPIKDNNNKIVGAVFVGKPEGSSELSAKISSLKIGKVGQAYLIDSKGNTIIQNGENKNIGQYDFIKEIIKDKNGMKEYSWEGKKKTSSYRYFEKWDWYVIAVADNAEIFKNANDLFKIIVAIGIGFIFLIIVIGYLIADGISMPIKLIVEAFEAMKAGNLSYKIKVNSRDEMGLLAESFNQMNFSLKTIIEEVQESSNAVSTASNGLSKVTDESNKTMEEISKGITDIANSTQDNALLIRQTKAGVHEVTNSLQIVAASAEEIAHLSDNVNLTAKDGEDSVKQIVNVVNDIFKSSQNVIILINELNNSSSKIGSIIELMNEISERINLLALNAAIEAARAGEHGKGFAVVADEVRKLADQSKQSTMEILSLINSVQEKTGKVIEAVKESDEKVKLGVKDAEDTYGNIIEIMSSIKGVGAKIDEISKNTELQAKAAGQISRSMELVSTATETTSLNIQEISAGMEEQVSTFEEVGATAQEMNEMAEKLQTLVNNFKIK